jgi:hypothetical protein
VQLVVAIAGLIVAIIAIPVTFVVARRYRDRRELSYEISTTPSLLSVDEVIKRRVEIRYEGREVRNLSGATVTIRSAGNRGVEIPRKSETETPITLTFGHSAEIIGEPRVTKTNPDHLDATVTATHGKVVLEPMLLNPGESVSIFSLLTNPRAEVKVEGHIKDVDIKEMKPDRRRLPAPVVASVGGVIGALLAALVVIPGYLDIADSPAKSLDEAYFFFLGGLVVAALLVALRRPLIGFLSRQSPD